MPINPSLTFLPNVFLLYSLIYSSTGAAYKGGSEGKTNEGGSPVVQGEKDRTPRTWRDTGEMERVGPR
jgi:hypothetical protein